MSRPASPAEAGFGPRSLALFVLLSCTWGASYLFIKEALRDMPVGWVVFSRTLLGALALTPLVLASGTWRALRGHWRAVAVLGLTQNALALGLIALGEVWIPSSLAGVLVATSPLFTVLFAPLAGVPGALRRMVVIGLLVGFAGVVTVLGPDLHSGWRIVAGSLCVLATASLYGFAAHWVRLRLDGVPRIAMVWAGVGLAAILTLPVALADLPEGLPGPKASISLLVLGILGTGFAFVIFNHLVPVVGASRASLVSYVAVVVSVALGVLALDETFTAVTAVGIALILAGSFAVARG